MPRGYWCILVALVGIALAGASPPNYPDQANQTEGNQTGAETPPYKPYADRKSERCYESGNHESADLCAQWSAADAAKETAGLSYWGNWIAGFGAVLSFFSILLVLWALKQGRDANEIAKDTAKRELRAYVTTEDHDIVGFWRGGPTTLRMKIYNRGQTPAYDLKVWSIVGGTLEGPDDFKVKQIKNPDFRQSKTMLGPGQWILHTNSCQSPLDGNAYLGVVHGKLKLVFAGVLSYRDVFGRRRFTIFKQFYTGCGNFAEQNSDLVACGRGNTGS
jgi:hypothetical protein